jgi:hypothetical protein
MKKILFLVCLCVLIKLTTTESVFAYVDEGNKVTCYTGYEKDDGTMSIYRCEDCTRVYNVSRVLDNTLGTCKP